MQAEDLVINTYVIQPTRLFVSSVFHIDSSMLFFFFRIGIACFFSKEFAEK